MDCAVVLYPAGTDTDGADVVGAVVGTAVVVVGAVVVTLEVVVGDGADV